MSPASFYPLFYFYIQTSSNAAQMVKTITRLPVMYRDSWCYCFADKIILITQKILDYETKHGNR